MLTNVAEARFMLTLLWPFALLESAHHFVLDPGISVCSRLACREPEYAKYSNAATINLLLLLWPHNPTPYWEWCQSFANVPTLRWSIASSAAFFTPRTFERMGSVRSTAPFFEPKGLLVKPPLLHFQPKLLRLSYQCQIFQAGSGTRPNRLQLCTTLNAGSFQALESQGKR